MSQETNNQSGMQADAPPKPEAGFTAEAPARAVVRRRRFRWPLPPSVLLALLAIAALVVAGTTAGVVRYLDFVPGPSPTTQMTLQKANLLANEAPTAGSDLKDVDVWLTSRGHFARIKQRRADGLYVDRRVDGVYVENDTTQQSLPQAAQDAGLNKDDVYSFIPVVFPASNVTSNGYDEVSIYFFFDAHDRLIKYWVVLRHVGVHAV